MRETEERRGGARKAPAFVSLHTLPNFFTPFTNVNASSLSIYASISSIFPVFCHGVTRFLHHYPYVTSVCLTRTQMHLPQSQPLHRINVFACVFHGFISVLLLHKWSHIETAIFPLLFHCFTRALRENGPTSEPQVFHCCSILSISVISLLFYLASFSSDIRAAIFPFRFHCFTPLLHHIVSRFFHFFSIANGLTSTPHFFDCFSIVLLNIVFPSIPVSPVFFSQLVPPILFNHPIVYAMSLSIHPSMSSFFPMFCHGVSRFLHHYPYATSVCLTRTQRHLSQSLPLHGITGFGRFFHGFISVLLLQRTGTVLPKHIFIFHHIPLKLALAVRSGSVGAHNGDELAEGGSEEE